MPPRSYGPAPEYAKFPLVRGGGGGRKKGPPPGAGSGAEPQVSNVFNGEHVGGRKNSGQAWFAMYVPGVGCGVFSRVSSHQQGPSWLGPVGPQAPGVPQAQTPSKANPLDFTPIPPPPLRGSQRGTWITRLRARPRPDAAAKPGTSTHWRSRSGWAPTRPGMTGWRWTSQSAAGRGSPKTMSIGKTSTTTCRASLPTTYLQPGKPLSLTAAA